MLGNLKKEGREIRDSLRAEHEQEKVKLRSQPAVNQKIYRPLPLSPLMDPSKIDARQRHRRPKSAKEEQLTPFQRKLAANPYGA